jgi:hypothetical protein
MILIVLLITLVVFVPSLLLLSRMIYGLAVMNELLHAINKRVTQ